MWSWKLPSPGSLGARVSLPAAVVAEPLESCSPFRGKSSWNTNTDSFAVGYGEGCVRAVTVIAGAQLVAGAAGVQVVAAVVPTGAKVQTVVPAAFGPQATAGIGVPPIPWPQCPVVVQSGVPAYPAPNGLAASPGSTEM